MTHPGSCHCGRIAVDVEGDLQGVVVAVNIRCLDDDVEPDKLPVAHFDGCLL